MNEVQENPVEMANLIETNGNGIQSAETSLSNPTAAEIDNVEVRIVDPNRSQQQTVPRRPSNSTNQQQGPRVADSEEEDDEIVLKYGAEHVVKLFVPVTLCLFFVICSLSFVKSYQESGGATLVYTPFNEDQQSNGTKLWMSIANASIFISVVIVMTIVLIILYKFKCYRIIHGWLAFSSLMLLFFFTYMYISEIFKQFNIVTDMITIVLLLWNFGILGMFCIHWKGPLFLQQVFLIFSCIQMALIFIKYLPEWTTWVLLALISVWDLVAVLCPFGPLRILVETAHERQDNLFPAMVYSSTVMYSLVNMADTSNENSKKNNSMTSSGRSRGMAGPGASTSDGDGTIQVQASSTNHDNGSNNSENNNPVRSRISGSNAQNTATKTGSESAEENGVKLGLGDFIFYSILVGKASILGDWNTVIACVVAILIGLCLTLVLLAVFHKPLPALPISLLFGLIFYFLTNLVVRPFYETLAFKQVFI